MRWRDSREAVKKGGEGVMNNLWSGLSVTVIEPYKAGGGLGNVSCCFVFCLRTGVTEAAVCASRWGVGAGLGVCRSPMVEEKGRWRGEKGKMTPYRKTSLLLSSVGTFACAAREMAVSLSFTPWSETVMISLKFQRNCLCLRIRKMYKTFGHHRAEA